jgi:hypothetical protein
MSDPEVPSHAGNRRNDPIQAASAFVFLAQLSIEELAHSQLQDADLVGETSRLLEAASDFLSNALAEREAALSALSDLYVQSSVLAQSARVYCALDHFGKAIFDCWVRSEECRRGLASLVGQGDGRGRELVAQLAELYELLTQHAAN